MSRREWLLVIAAAVMLQALGLWRSVLPAQDGLKFLRVARDFQLRPFADVVRGSDQHPLYPLGIALVEPLTRPLLGRSPTNWRVAAQLVSAVAWVAMLLPIYGIGRALFNRPTAKLACLLQLALPASAEFGHETLSDPLALSLLMTGLWLGLVAVRRGKVVPSLLCGAVFGLGYWTRPEVAVAPIALVAWGLWRFFENRRSARMAELTATARRAGLHRLGSAGLVFCAVVGVYATVKGELSEKLALRHSASISSRHDAARPAAHAVPPEIRKPGMDFSPKEESAPKPWGPAKAAARLVRGWFGGLGWVFATLTAWGVLRVRARSSSRLLGIYSVLFGTIAVRHAMMLGYLSDRHLLSLALLSLPWTAAGLRKIGLRLAEVGALSLRSRRIAGAATVAVVLMSASVLQAKPSHLTRSGHLDAGRWLAAHAAPDDAVLDTRGWANFIAGRTQYDYWHVGQALGDRRLKYLVVGRDELTADSPRAATLRTIVQTYGRTIRAYPESSKPDDSTVLIVRLRLPGAGKGPSR
jgi:hypothetical protein